MTPEQKREIKIMEAFKMGKTIQSYCSGKWQDFVPQNQLDRPNFYYSGIHKWRIKEDHPVEDEMLEDYYIEYLDREFNPFFYELTDIEKNNLRESFGFWKYCVRRSWAYFILTVKNQIKNNLRKIGI